LVEQINLFEREVKSDLAINVRYPTELSDHLRQSISIISVGRNDYINNYLQPQFYDSDKLYHPKPFVEHLIEIYSQQINLQTHLLYKDLNCISLMQLKALYKR